MVLTATLKFVSGVPTIEDRYKENTDYLEYRLRTNCMIPWCPQKQLKLKIDASMEADENVL